MLHPLQQRFLNLINQENFAQISQEEAVKQEIVATLEALCGIAEATQIDNVAALFSFLMDFLSSCIGLMEVNRLKVGGRLRFGAHSGKLSLQISSPYLHDGQGL